MCRNKWFSLGQDDTKHYFKTFVRSLDEIKQSFSYCISDWHENMASKEKLNRTFKSLCQKVLNQDFNKV